MPKQPYLEIRFDRSMLVRHIDLTPKLARTLALSFSLGAPVESAQFGRRALAILRTVDPSLEPEFHQADEGTIILYQPSLGGIVTRTRTLAWRKS